MSKFAGQDPKAYRSQDLIVYTKSERWRFDNIEEFLGEYKPDARHATCAMTLGDYSCDAVYTNPNSERSAQAPTRQEIQTVLNIFEDAVPDSKLPEREAPVKKPVIFIGHGATCCGVT